MKHKLTLGLVLIFAAALLIFSTGCPKTTGGGWFNNLCNDEVKVTFGFNVQPTDDSVAKGKFQLVDHSTKTRIHGTFDGTLDGEVPGLWQTFSGKCTIVTPEGTYPEVDFWIDVWDLGEGVNEIANDWIGDGIAVHLYRYGNVVYGGILGGGNIEVHVPKK
jgi:hypothetical protein